MNFKILKWSFVKTKFKIFKASIAGKIKTQKNISLIRN